MEQPVRALAARLAGTAALLIVATMTVAGCGGTTASSGTTTHTGGKTHASSAPGGQAHLTGNLCTDAAAANNGVRVLTEAVVLHRSGHQQVSRLLRTVVGTYAALGSEAPGQVKGAFITLAGYYRGIEATVAGGRQLTLSDIQPATHPGVVSAVRRISEYFAAHCAA